MNRSPREHREKDRHDDKNGKSEKSGKHSSENHEEQSHPKHKSGNNNKSGNKSGKSKSEGSSRKKIHNRSLSARRHHEENDLVEVDIHGGRHHRHSDSKSVRVYNKRHEHIHEHVYEHEHDHEHDHVHEHEHEHDHHSHDHDYDYDRRRHHQHWDHHHHQGAVVDVRVHKRDQSGPSGTPGFVEVASTLFHSNLAKTVAGLVFSKDPEGNSSDFMLGTSDSHSTQFYLAQINGTARTASLDDMVPINTLPANTTVSKMNATGVPMYQLRVPVLNSQTLQPDDYCATFDVKPPSPLSMQPCGQVDGHSQAFSYDTTTGQLVPVYPPTNGTASTVKAAVKMSDPTASPFASNATSSLTNPPSNMSAPVSDADMVAAAAPVSLYFVPSSGITGSQVKVAGTDSPQLAQALPDVGSISSSSALAVSQWASLASTATAASADITSLFTPAVKAANVVTDSAAPSAPTDSSVSSASISDGMATLTITATITTSMSGPSATSGTISETLTSDVSSASAPTSTVSA
ncbi:hypothetical protein EMMF5_004411 [Cystobasidiomycetes sp. EMM_F5]